MADDEQKKGKKQERDGKAWALLYALGTLLLGATIVSWAWAMFNSDDYDSLSAGARLMNAGTATAPMAGIGAVGAIFVALRQLRQSSKDGLEQTEGIEDQLKLQREAVDTQKRELDIRLQSNADQIRALHRQVTRANKLSVLSEIRGIFGQWISTGQDVINGYLELSRYALTQDPTERERAEKARATLVTWQAVTSRLRLYDDISLGEIVIEILRIDRELAQCYDRITQYLGDTYVARHDNGETPEDRGEFIDNIASFLEGMHHSLYNVLDPVRRWLRAQTAAVA